jgi:hypothetical protein
MRLSQKTLLKGAGLAGAGMLSALGFAAVRWDRATNSLIERMRQASIEKDNSAGQGPSKVRSDLFSGGSITDAELSDLPEPVSRYFRTVLPANQVGIVSAQITQAGHFKSSGIQSKWQPFTANQYFTSPCPGFVWDATIQLAPATRICVRDSYIAQVGITQAKILALMSVMDMQPSAELNASSLQRYLAESVWFPTSLLPRAGVKWDSIDSDTAMATIIDGSNTASLAFSFNENGEISRLYTPGRYREIAGSFELTPWEVTFHSYQLRHGIKVPTEVEVSWQIEQKNSPYFKARLIDIQYEFAVSSIK